MAIVRMKKFTLLTFHSYKAALLADLQKFGDIHFRNLQGGDDIPDFLLADSSPNNVLRCEAQLDQVTFTLSKLKPFVEKPKLTAKRPTLSYDAFSNYLSNYEYEDICGKIKALDDSISSKQSDISRIKNENDNLKAWIGLDVAPEELDKLDTVKYLVGTVGNQLREQFEQAIQGEYPSVYLEFLGTVKDDTAILMLFPSELYDEMLSFAKDQGFSYASLTFRKIPAEQIRENEQRIPQLEQEIQEIQQKIQAQSGEYEKLQITQDALRTVLAREQVSDNFLKTEETVMAEGWVPDENTPDFTGILNRICGENYYVELQDVEKDSPEVPIKLKNNGFVHAFESITEMYAMPRYNEIDPTPLLTGFYWLFFGLMMGDIGYGLLLLIATILIPKVVDLKDGMKSFMRFFQYLSISTIGAGILYGGCFGITVFAPIADPAAPTGYRAILDSQLSIVTMLIMSIIIGVIHILFGLCVKAYMGFRDGDFLSGFADGIVFMATVLSGIGWLLGGAGLADGIMAPCRLVFIVCLVLIAATQGRSSPSIGGKIGNGLYAVYGLTSYVGDIVSYTRITALALSGAYIGYAFNTMTELVMGDFASSPVVVSIIRLILGAVVAIFGHLLNLGLALLGAYVHTCRLQYVEFFGKFYEGGGRPFRPFSIKVENSHITK